MSKFDDFIAALEEGAKGLAREMFSGFEDQAKDDARAFASKAETDLKKWTTQLALKQIDKEEFCDLVKAKQAVMEIQPSPRQASQWSSSNGSAPGSLI